MLKTCFLGSGVYRQWFLSSGLCCIGKAGTFVANGTRAELHHDGVELVVASLGCRSLLLLSHQLLRNELLHSRSHLHPQ
eukprot:1762126-Rhodomonas_salina.1